MSAHKHTPGPWHSTGRYVGSGHAKMNICECSDNSGCWSNAPEAVANARLIAAAPELLSSLQFAVKLLPALPHVNGTAQLDYMRAVIAKATGEAP